MIFIDSNVPMYLVGAAHPNKIDAHRLLEQAIAEGRRLVTDAEVLQEILHRYAAIGRKDAIQPAFEAIKGVVDEIFPLEAADADRAREILLGSATVSARDAIHLSIMQRHGVATIMSFDAGYDGFPGIRRMPPPG
ncbi:MAG: type II toxin-antitoxin system VapC family toxin [Deltaproteobacteria bacterium]